MNKDPRRGTTCAGPDCHERLTIPKTSYATHEQYLADGFCSRSCCERFYGLPVEVRDAGNRGGGRKKVYAT